MRRSDIAHYFIKMNPMELPRDLSKLKSKFPRPLIIEDILNELYDNEPRPQFQALSPDVNVEPDVALKKGLRFTFVYSLRHNGWFLFVECTESEAKLSWYTNGIRADRYQDFILMDIYAIVGGGNRVQCCSLECCVARKSLISLMPLSCSVDYYKFDLMLVGSSGEKGFIATVYVARLYGRCEEPPYF
jgi:hypothetical protein